MKVLVCACANTRSAVADAKIVLGLGMDEFDEDEDEQIDIDGVPFAAEKDFLEKYGTAFTLSYGENKEVVLTANQA